MMNREKSRPLRRFCKRMMRDIGELVYSVYDGRGTRGLCWRPKGNVNDD